MIISDGADERKIRAQLIRRGTPRYFADEIDYCCEAYGGKRRIGISESSLPGKAGVPVRPPRASEARSDSLRARGRAPGAIVLARDAFLHAQGNRQRRRRRPAEPRDTRAGQVAVRSRLLEPRPAQRASDA